MRAESQRTAHWLDTRQAPLMHDEDQQTCGQELAASADIPDDFGRLFRHVAINLRNHALAVGSGSAGASRERDALLRVASGYEEIADAAERTAQFMRTLATLPAVPHGTDGLGRDGFVDWMTTKIAIQRRLGTTLLEHAEQSAHVLAKRVSTGG